MVHLDDPNGDDDPAAKKFKSDNSHRENFIPERCRTTSEPPKQQQGYDKSKFPPVKRKIATSSLSSSSGANAKPKLQRQPSKVQFDLQPQVARYSHDAQIKIDGKRSSTEVPGRMKTKPQPLRAPTGRGSRDSSSLLFEEQPHSAPAETPSEALAKSHQFPSTLQRANSSESERRTPSRHNLQPIRSMLPESERQMPKIPSNPHMSAERLEELLARKPPKKCAHSNLKSRSLCMRDHSVSPTPVYRNQAQPTQSTRKGNSPDFGNEKTSNTTGNVNTRPKTPIANGLNDPDLAEFFNIPTEVAKTKPAPSTANKGKTVRGQPQSQSQPFGSIRRTPSKAFDQTRKAHLLPSLMSLRLSPPPNFFNPHYSPRREIAAQNFNQNFHRSTYHPASLMQHGQPPDEFLSNGFSTNQLGQHVMTSRGPEPNSQQPYPGPASPQMHPNNFGYNFPVGQHQADFFNQQQQQPAAPMDPYPAQLYNGPPTAMSQMEQTFTGPPVFIDQNPVTRKNLEMQDSWQLQDMHQNQLPLASSGSILAPSNDPPRQPKTKEEMEDILARLKIRNLLPVTETVVVTPTASAPKLTLRLSNGIAAKNVQVKMEISSGESSRASSPAREQSETRSGRRSAIQPPRVNVSSNSGSSARLTVKTEPMSPQENRSVQNIRSVNIKPEPIPEETSTTSSPERPTLVLKRPPTPTPSPSPAPSSPFPYTHRPPRTPPGSPPSEAEPQDSLARYYSNFSETEIEQHNLLVEIGSFTLQGTTRSNLTSPDYKDMFGAEYFVATDPSKDDYVRKLKKYTNVFMNSTVEWWRAESKALVIWTVQETGKRPTLWFFRPGSCFHIKDIPPFYVPVVFTVAPLGLNTWFGGYKAVTKPYPHGTPLRQPPDPPSEFVETNAAGEEVPVDQWQCNVCQFYVSREEFHTVRKCCASCYPWPNDSFWVPSTDAPPALVDYHETNSSTPHWSPAIRMNPDYAPRVQQQQEEARLNHEGTADSALVTGNRSRSGSSVSSHSSVRYASMRSSTSPVSAAPLDRQQFSDEYINLETILVAGVNDIRKKSFHSYWTLTVALLNGLRSMYDATMRFNDFGSPTHVRRLCGNFVELFEDIVNWSFAEFLDYFEIVIDTNPVDFIASMQVPCFHEAVVELVNVLKKKSRKIVRDAKKWEKLEKQIQKELEQGKTRNYQYFDFDSDEDLSEEDDDVNPFHEDNEYQTVSRLSHMRNFLY